MSVASSEALYTIDASIYKSYNIDPKKIGNYKIINLDPDPIYIILPTPIADTKTSTVKKYNFYRESSELFNENNPDYFIFDTKNEKQFCSKDSSSVLRIIQYDDKYTISSNSDDIISKNDDVIFTYFIDEIRTTDSYTKDFGFDKVNKTFTLSTNLNKNVKFIDIFEFINNKDVKLVPKNGIYTASKDGAKIKVRFVVDFDPEINKSFFRILDKNTSSVYRLSSPKITRNLIFSEIFQDGEGKIKEFQPGFATWKFTKTDNKDLKLYFKSDKWSYEEDKLWDIIDSNNNSILSNLITNKKIQVSSEFITSDKKIIINNNLNNGLVDDKPFIVIKDLQPGTYKLKFHTVFNNTEKDGVPEDIKLAIADNTLEFDSIEELTYFDPIYDYTIDKTSNDKYFNWIEIPEGSNVTLKTLKIENYQHIENGRNIITPHDGTISINPNNSQQLIFDSSKVDISKTYQIRITYQYNEEPIIFNDFEINFFRPLQFTSIFQDGKPHLTESQEGSSIWKFNTGNSDTVKFYFKSNAYSGERTDEEGYILEGEEFLEALYDDDNNIVTLNNTNLYSSWSNLKIVNGVIEIPSNLNDNFVTGPLITIRKLKLNTEYKIKFKTLYNTNDNEPDVKLAIENKEDVNIPIIFDTVIPFNFDNQKVLISKAEGAQSITISLEVPTKQIQNPDNTEDPEDLITVLEYNITNLSIVSTELLQLNAIGIRNESNPEVILIDITSDSLLNYDDGNYIVGVKYDVLGSTYTSYFTIEIKP